MYDKACTYVHVQVHKEEQRGRIEALLYERNMHFNNCE